MKALISNIKLISFGYMNSNNNTLGKPFIENNIELVLPRNTNSNNTLDKFGIEYSYIAIAMNNMLGFTNNHVKNIVINKTSAIAIDWTGGCIYSLVEVFGDCGILEFLFIAALLASGQIGCIGLIGTPALATFSPGDMIVSC